MGRIKEVTVGLRRLYKHPYEDFENFTIEGAITSEVDEDEDPFEVAKKSFPVLRKQMIETFHEFKPKKRTPKK